MIAPKEPPKVKIEAFAPPAIQIMNSLGEFDKAYGALRIQEEKARVSLVDLQTKVHELRTDNKIKLLVPYGGGMMRYVDQFNKKELMQKLMQTKGLMENQYSSYVGQREHRANELGEARVRIFKMLSQCLISQHDFSPEDLLDLMKQKPELTEMQTKYEEKKRIREKEGQ